MQEGQCAGGSADFSDEGHVLRQGVQGTPTASRSGVAVVKLLMPCILQCVGQHGLGPQLDAHLQRALSVLCCALCCALCPVLYPVLCAVLCALSALCCAHLVNCVEHHVNNIEEINRENLSPKPQTDVSHRCTRQHAHTDAHVSTHRQTHTSACTDAHVPDVGHLLGTQVDISAQGQLVQFDVVTSQQNTVSTCMHLSLPVLCVSISASPNTITSASEMSCANLRAST